MKVLLTGANGFLGRYVLRLLQQSGTAVVALGRTRPPDCGASAFIAADLLAGNDFAALARQAGASHLLHLAWVTEHGQYWTSPLNFRWVDATTRLVQAFCETGGKHVVVAGSCAEYDWGSGLCNEDTTPLSPATVYGVAKDATRRLVEVLCVQHGVRCAWGRVFFPFGAGEGPARLVPQLVDALQGRLAGFGVNAPALRDFLHAQDVARALLALLRCPATGSYNVSSGRPVQIGELVRTLAQLTGRDPLCILGQPSERAFERPQPWLCQAPRGGTRKLGSGPAFSCEPAALVGDNLKLQALGWRQELTLGQGLQRMLHDLSVAGSGQEAVPHGA